MSEEMISEEPVVEALSELQVLQEKVTSLEVLLQEEADQKLRAFAELENFRKRKDQEVDTFKKFASEKAILAMLPVLDSLVLACTHAQSHHASPEKLREGFEMIQKQFEQALEKVGVQKIVAEGQAFDPNRHQAVSQEAADGIESQVVVREMQAGYTLHDRVIRPSMVVIAA